MQVNVGVCQGRFVRVITDPNLSGFVLLADHEYRRELLTAVHARALARALWAAATETEAAEAAEAAAAAAAEEGA